MPLEPPEQQAAPGRGGRGGRLKQRIVENRKDEMQDYMERAVEFSDYLLAGDRLGIDVDDAANRLLRVSVATYLDKPDDKVTLHVRMGSLTDGTGFTEQTTLEAAAKNIRVIIQNGGHRPMAR